MVNLDVNYISQWDPTASDSRNECGEASAAMILNFYGEHLTPNQITEKTGAGLGLVSVVQLQQAIKAFGYDSQFVRNATPAHITGYLDKAMPVIALVHYGSLNSTQDKSFKGGHFFAVVGYREDGYFVNDPNFQGQFRQDGDHHFYTKAEFETAWGSCHLDQNPDNCFIVIFPKAPAPQTAYTGTVTQGNGDVNIRNTPHLAGTIITHYPTGTSLPLEAQTTGDSVLNNNIWYKIQGKDEYVWSGRIAIQAQSAPETPTVFTQTPPPTPQPEQPVIITDDHALIDIGGSYGTQELQAVRSLLKDKDQNLISVQTQLVQKSTLLDKIAHLFGLS